MQDAAALPFQPSPIAQLMQLEVLGVEQIDGAVRNEPVRNKGHACVRERLIAAVQIHVIEVGAVFGEIVHILASGVEGRDDEVHRAACDLLDDVHRGLERPGRDLAAHVFDVGFQEAVIAACKPVDGGRVAEHRLQARDLVALGTLHVQLVAGAYRGRRRRTEFDGLRVAVDGDYARAAEGGVLDVRSVINVHGHPFHESAHAVHGQDVVAFADVCHGGRDKTAAVAVKHTSEIEFAGFEQPVHFRVEQIDERACAVLGRSHRLVGYLYPAEQVFEGEGELRIIVAAAHGQAVRFAARAYAAVDAVRGEFPDLFAPDVRARLTYLREQRIHPDVELIGKNAEIKCL